MIERKLGLRLVMDELGLALTTFQDRLTMQHSIYLLQQLGLDFGYHFERFPRGPYSQALAEDAFDAMDSRGLVTEWTTKYRLGPRAQAVIRKFRYLIEGTRPTHIDRARWTELLALIHFVHKTKLREVMRNLTDDERNAIEKALLYVAKARTDDSARVDNAIGDGVETAEVDAGA